MMKARRLDLGGEWNLRHALETADSPTTPDQMAQAGMPSIVAHVPGNVELDLVRAGELEEPFFGTNMLTLRPLEFHRWWYQRQFETPEWTAESATELVFEGLDCFATVWVNGVELGLSTNALIAHRFDISAALSPVGEFNTITVRIDSPVNAVRDLPVDTNARTGAHQMESLSVRKPPHCYGWDIMPRALSAGIWRPVYLEEQRSTELADVFPRVVSLSAGSASLRVRVAFRTDTPVLEGFSVRLRGRCGESHFEHEGPLHFTTADVNVHIANPKLWWPRGYGKANLYDLEAELLHDGVVVATMVRQFGVRTVELDRTDTSTREAPGHFVFKVNGKRIFAKGSNWVPMDAFHSRDAERIPAALALFSDMGCNMVRCWGGNVYEPELFYEICDREGILVWQDFSMACALYPQDSEFCSAMREEAECVVRSLRHHPSIALWSGDNECDQAAVGWLGNGMDPGRNCITRQVLPEVIGRLDPDRPYLPSSPYIAPDVMRLGGDQFLAPEQHLWGPRDYYKSDFYAKNTACFASEMGYHGCPNVSSLKRFISEAELWPFQDSLQWQLHATDPVPGVSGITYRNQLMANQVLEVFGHIPEELETFSLASQIVQAEAKKFFVEIFRQQKWRTSGLLWWNMIDGWPQISDAVVDYYYTKKLAYYYLKRVHTPLCVIVREPGAWNSDVVVCNDSLDTRKGHVRVWDAETDDVVLDSSFEVGENANALLERIKTPYSEQRLLLIEWTSDGERGTNHFLQGSPGFSLERYRSWLPKIAALDGSFESSEIAR